MGFRIVIAGISQCETFAQICLVADHLVQNLPNFCYERIQKSVIEWKVKYTAQICRYWNPDSLCPQYCVIGVFIQQWLSKINQKYKWHHLESPLIWKELLMKGSKPYYIGGASEFLDYCHSYYHFDSYMTPEKFSGILENISQYQNKVKNEKESIQTSLVTTEIRDATTKNQFTVCISGIGFPLAMHLISGLLEMAVGEKCVSRLYIYDDECSEMFMEFVEQECSYIIANNPGKVVKVVSKLGSALTHTDLLIILNHMPFNIDYGIGDWLQANKEIMTKLAMYINASAYRKMCILLPNLGPACYNASILMNMVTNISKRNIVVATSDLGLDISAVAAEVAEVPMKNIFCSPVWGFVGINHLVDIKTTIHKYNSFEPYNRCTKVKDSSLTIGSLTPELRTMEYLMYFDDTLWAKVTESKNKISNTQQKINISTALLDVVKLWLLDPNPSNIVNLGILCNGSFGLTFCGAFSQPARLVNGVWMPASDFFMPKDAQMKLPYLEQMANLCLSFQSDDLPNLVPYYPCYCKPKYCKKKEVW